MTVFENKSRLYMRDGSGLAVVYVGTGWVIFLCAILFDMEMIKQCRELFLYIEGSGLGASKFNRCEQRERSARSSTFQRGLEKLCSCHRSVIEMCSLFREKGRKLSSLTV